MNALWLGGNGYAEQNQGPSGAFIQGRVKVGEAGIGQYEYFVT